MNFEEIGETWYMFPTPEETEFLSQDDERGLLSSSVIEVKHYRTVFNKFLECNYTALDLELRIRSLGSLSVNSDALFKLRRDQALVTGALADITEFCETHSVELYGFEPDAQDPTDNV